MALLIGNVSLQACSVKVFLQIEILYPNHKIIDVYSISRNNSLQYTTIVENTRQK